MYIKNGLVWFTMHLDYEKYCSTVNTCTGINVDKRDWCVE